jgi:serine/threonine protein kinase
MEERSKQFMETAVKDFKVFIDTCSLLHVGADRFWINIVPVLEREKKSVIVPYRVYEELEKFAGNQALCLKKNPNDPKFNLKAKKSLENVVKLQKAKLVEIFGDSTDNFADNVFLTVFTQFRMKYNLMLITQDGNLARDITNIDKSKSVTKCKKISVAQIDTDGVLRAFEFKKQPKAIQSATSKKISQPKENNNMHIPDEEKFALAKTITAVSGTVSASYIPKEGDTVIAERSGQKNAVKLVKQVASGGEGIIYTTNKSNIVAKIYKRDKIDKAKYEKLKLMLTKSIDCEGVCFPIAVIYNSKNEFVGYLMKKAQGKELQKCVFIPQLLKKTFPKWKKTDTVQLCITILEKLKYLHDRNIILGDINPNNILVVSPKEVYFVDADSYQVEGFPCPVGTINFTAPEIQLLPSKDFKTFLRTIGNEKFAVATLLFMIMLPGKPPYSIQGGENQIDNIIKGDFAYAFGEKTTGKAPEGMWRFCWSHLPRYLKGDFYETFRKGEPHSTEKTRYSTDVWLQKFESYMRLLENGKLAEQDSMSMELFPTRLKNNPNAANDKKNIVYNHVSCSNCGVAFTITYGEKEFFEKKGYDLPKKCKNCRGNKAGRSAATGTASKPDPSSSARPKASSTGTASQSASLNSTTQVIDNITAISGGISVLMRKLFGR